MGILKRLSLSVAMLLIAAVAAVPSAHATDISLDRSVKAAFLYKFLSYIDWPPESLPEDAPLQIGVLGSDDMVDELTKVVHERLVGAHSIEVKKLSADDPLAHMNVVFVAASASAAANLPALAKRAQQQGALVVSESEGALAKGSIINFVPLDGKVRFEVDLDNATSARLRISSRMLAVALKVTGTP